MKKLKSRIRKLTNTIILEQQYQFYQIKELMICSIAFLKDSSSNFAIKLYTSLISGTSDIFRSFLTKTFKSV